MFWNKSREKYYNIFVSLRCEMNIVVIDVDSIKELETEKIEPVEITSEGETRPYKIVKGEVILTNEQMKEILKNL